MDRYTIIYKTFWRLSTWVRFTPTQGSRNRGQELTLGVVEGALLTYSPQTDCECYFV